MKEIPLGRSCLVALVDDDDYDYLAQFNWLINQRGYVFRCADNSQRFVFMHREIMGLPRGDQREVDHIDGNKRNHQRSNLRVCSHFENTLNKKMSRRNTSGYKGVTWSKRDGRWQAQIMIKGKQKWLGQFSSPEAAHRAYCAAADALHGEFANYGFPRH